MIEAENDRVIKVYGVCFHGVEELKRVALSRKPKGGVYVGMRQERYPCFDSYDYASEDRYYTHFVFARNAEVLEHRLRILHGMAGTSVDGNGELGPTVYWAGDTHHPMQIMECDDIVIQEKKLPRFMAALQEWNVRDEYEKYLKI